MTEREVQRRLTELDHNLFLDKVFSPISGIYYAVKYRMEDGVEPMVVVDWRAGNSQPLPLSEDLLVRVRSQEGSIHEAVQQATVHNVVLKEIRKQEILQEQEERAHEWDYEKRSKRRIIDLEKPYGF